MPAYGKTSSKRLETCHPLLQELFNSLAEDYNISILCGHRTEEEQNEAKRNKASKTKYPHSKHNIYPSHAVDAALYPVDWNDTGRNYMFAGIVRERARRLGINIRAGADWDSDFKTNDQTFHDVVHFELM